MVYLSARLNGTMQQPFCSISSEMIAVLVVSLALAKRVGGGAALATLRLMTTGTEIIGWSSMPS